MALTRVFSVMLSYHFVFAIVSGGMLGLGAGGLLFNRFGSGRPQRAVAIAALTFALSLAASVVLILTLPIYASQTLAGLRFWVYICLAIVPFAAAGFAVSGMFQRFAGKSAFLYGADLLGAASGALVIVPAMDAFGAVNVVFLLAAIAALAALLLGVPERRKLASVIALVVLGALFAVGIVSNGGLHVPITNDPHKDEFQMLADHTVGAKVIENRWSSFGRTDLVRMDDPNEMWIFVDGSAGSAMYRPQALRSNTPQRMHVTKHFGEYFALQSLTAEEKRSALIIGPGGGRDVEVALLGGVQKITAVEVNPDIVRIVREHSKYNGAIYSGRPGVKVVVGEGRNYARTVNQRFNLIMAAIPVTKSSRSVEGYALTENNLFTIEAFRDYLDHLTDNGRIIIVAHNSNEIYKLIALTLATFGRQGISEPEAMKHIYTVTSPMMPAVVIQKQPLTADQAKAIDSRMHDAGFDNGPLFIPYVGQRSDGTSQLDQALVDVSNGSISMERVVKEASADLRPPTDDRPFFYKFELGLPSPFPTFRILIALSLLAMVVLVMLPRKQVSDPLTFIDALRTSRALKTYLLLFFALGIGYMLVEIALFQRLTLYLGQPQRALTVLLFSLLLGGGIGSLLTSFLGRKGLNGGAVVSVGVALGIVALASVVSRVFSTGIDPRLGAMILILPLGILMGCPFPVAMRSLGAQGFQHHASVMWGVNGVASVLGSALSMIMGISWGFFSALLTGAAIYAAVAALFVLLGVAKRAKEPVPEWAASAPTMEVT